MSKRKPHNPIKRLIRQSHIAVADLALSMTLNEAEAGVQLRKYKTGQVVTIGPSVADALNRTSFKWYVLLLVYREESNGKRGIVSQTLPMLAPYRHDQLTGFLHDSHQAMIAEQKERGNKVLNAGWIALPVPPSEVNEDALIALMDYEEAWK